MSLLLTGVISVCLLFTPPDSVTIFTTEYSHSLGVDPYNAENCLGEVVYRASGTIYVGQRFTGHISGPFGYQSLPRGLITNNTNPCGSASYSGEARATGSAENGRSHTFYLRAIQRPIEEYERNDDRTFRFTCHPDSGGGGGSGGGIDCEIGAGGTGGSTLELNDDTSCVSPILIDLAGDGFAFGGPENPVIFDLLGLGQPLVLQWVQPGSDDAFLVNDLNGNGFVDDGAELFGNGSRMQLRPGELAINGFQALAQWDRAALGGNEDGVITREDMVWHQLRLWVDADADGISQAHELRPIGRLRSLHTIPVEDAHYDAFGNLLLFWSQAQTGRRNYIMVDVFFRVL